MRLLFFCCLFLLPLQLDLFANKQTKYEVRLGSNVAATILGKYTQSTDQEMIKYVNLVGQSIVQTSGRKDIHYYFSVLDETQPLAMACPGGYIFISSGLINMLDSEAQLAGILAHEIAHVNEKHVFDQVYNSSNNTTSMITQMLMAQNTSGSVVFGELSNKAVSILLDKGLHEEDEYEADVAAIMYLKNTGYNADSYIDLIHKLPTDDSAHAKTHPEISERIEMLKAVFPNDFLDGGKNLKERFDKYAKN